jgi:hypothetical protein
VATGHDGVNERTPKRRALDAQDADRRQERLGVRLLKSVGPHFTLGMELDQPLAPRHAIIITLSLPSGQAHIQCLVDARG